MKKLLTIILGLAITLISCDKDDSGSGNPDPQPHNPNTFSENFGSEIQRNFLGNVIDTDRNPIQGVTITIGSSTAMTDTNGIFIINDATVNERFGYVKASKPGYLHGSRSVVPSSGTNKVTIMLLPETVAGTTNSGTSETITLPNGASVALEGDYQKADGSTYSGSVNIIMHHLDPANEDMQDQMPGMLYAANAQNEPRMLQTFGMLAVELRGSGGEELNIAEGSSAEIKVPLDASLMADAPSSIPLWHFDEQYGYWIEDGEANLVGNAYVGTVTHFSFWNCDIPAEYVNLCVNVTDADGLGLSMIWVDITSTIYGTAGGYTNELGEVCGLVPSNQSLTLSITLYNECDNDTIYSEPIGPFSSDASVDVVLSDLSGPSATLITENITGTFTDCSGNPIVNGYVRLSPWASQVYLVDNGNFEFNVLHCSNLPNTFNLQGYDYDNVQETEVINYTFTSPTTNVGTIAACNTIDEFITYQIDNDTIYNHYSNINAYFQLTGPNIPNPAVSVSASDSNNCFYAQGILNDAPYIGVYDSYNYQINGDTGFWIGECLNISEENNNIIYNLNTLGNIGEFIDINFSGSYDDYQGNPHTITGTIHVRRDD